MLHLLVNIARVLREREKERREKERERERERERRVEYMDVLNHAFLLHNSHQFIGSSVTLIPKCVTRKGSKTREHYMLNSVSMTGKYTSSKYTICQPADIPEIAAYCVCFCNGDYAVIQFRTHLM